MLEKNNSNMQPRTPGTEQGAPEKIYEKLKKEWDGDLQPEKTEAGIPWYEDPKSKALWEKMKKYTVPSDMQTKPILLREIGHDRIPQNEQEEEYDQTLADAVVQAPSEVVEVLVRDFIEALKIVNPYAIEKAMEKTDNPRYITEMVIQSWADTMAQRLKTFLEVGK